MKRGRNQLVSLFFARRMGEGEGVSHHNDAAFSTAKAEPFLYYE